ncbi:DNA-binding MarR family transcriptional regulator [Kribbella aluminosa]|uniref:DNA-binding MarR family transcriptional regulator n=1 Tax=Kribbella aluminosa TaxID=416017 RepID=A0ABS4UMA7_9ACTN|nr:MarR family transcriptional regulator [Kribbella aluminosa]MBP2352674.1 DNA-binding MarR family transcriptional regulator [Kribbella aluminosa]
MTSNDAAAKAQELRIAIGRVARRMRQIYAMHDGAGPTFTEVAVLVHLAREGPTSPTQLAGRERVTTQAITAVIRELESRKLVRRTAHPDDGRRTVITITSAGTAVIGDRELAVMSGLGRALEDSFTATERRCLEAVIPLLNKLADMM